jgi:SpoVK/Ycf46/Vps4 family AAA+-type ATPase
LDSYVGESEKNIRDLFLRALEQAPCVMFFDEIDSIAPARSRGNDSGGGVMDRMVSQFLTEMDQLRASGQKGWLEIFVFLFF